jgi:hypothetical protein
VHSPRHAPPVSVALSPEAEAALQELRGRFSAAVALNPDRAERPARNEQARADAPARPAKQRSGAEGA